jgi:hypothetical protein
MITINTTTITARAGRVQIRNSGLTLGQLRSLFARDLHATNPLDVPTDLLMAPRKTASVLRTMRGLETTYGPQAQQLAVTIASGHRAHQRVMGVRG